MGLFDEDFADDIDAGRVQSSEGLVEHQHLRVVYQRRSQLHSLLVPVRQCFNLTGGPVRDLQAFQPPHCAGSGGGVIYPVEPAQVLDLLGYEHVWIQAPLFGHVAEPASLVGPTGTPFQRTDPASRSVRPKIARMVVVLPAPFGPRNPTTCPDGTQRLSLSRAVTVPNRRLRLSISSTPATAAAYGCFGVGSLVWAWVPQ